MVYRALKFIKGYIDIALKKPMRFAYKIGLRPMHITYLSLPVGLLGVYFVFRQPVLGAVFVFSYVALDVFDGTLARATESVSEKGAKMDFLFDRLIAASFMVELIFQGISTYFAIFGLILVSLITLEDLGLIKR